MQVSMSPTSKMTQITVNDAQDGEEIQEDIESKRMPPRSSKKECRDEGKKRRSTRKREKPERREKRDRKMRKKKRNDENGLVSVIAV